MLEPLDQDENECEGHYNDDVTLLSGVGIGEPSFCDGSCVKGLTVARLPKIPGCAFCQEQAEYDGATKQGPWAYMCARDFQKHGVGLGTGKGQKLELEGEDSVGGQSESEESEAPEG